VKAMVRKPVWLMGWVREVKYPSLKKEQIYYRLTLLKFE
jgi:hypothetical protein